MFRKNPGRDAKKEGNKTKNTIFPSLDGRGSRGG